MKKLFLLMCLMFLCGTVQAETIHVQALENFSTANPPKTLKVKILTDIALDENLTLVNGDIVEGKIVDVVDPKRLKRNASFSFLIKNYRSVNDGITRTVDKDYIGSYTTEIDKKALAKTAALTAGNYFIHGISAGYTVIEGAVKNEEDNRLKSSAVALYNSSPLSYVQKGNDLVINENDIFFLKFRNKKELDDSLCD